MQNRFTVIAGALTILTAVLGVLTGIGTIGSVWPVAIAGVLSGLWWAFGRKILPEEFAADRAAKAERTAQRAAERG
ncbi:hypothetical protein GCM10023153_23610 [Ornithinibacter aureus]|uniref:Secreted protein n=1 Tax=Ornithinibacter aureus TaxID=622664 RepID=A0ABP8JZX0_9MICO|nr:hypothetical protein [Ornithinibacter aureus]KAF0834276.1 hypothetical protein C8E84_2094 [Ornithinibacter aureus]